MKSLRVCRNKLLVLGLAWGTFGAVIAPAQKFDRDFLERTIPKYPHHDCPSLLIYNLVEMYKVPGLMKYITDEMVKLVEQLNPDYIAAPEARALPVFGAVHVLTGKPGIFIRKAGKLPRNAPLATEVYKTAYSDESLQLVADPAYRGKTAVIFDDGLSSGGTTLATIRLLESQGIRVVGIFAMIEYHYRKRVPEYAPWENKTFTLFDLSKPLPEASLVERFETERKFLVPKLASFPAMIRTALLTGADHPYVLRRGYGLQEYLPLEQIPKMIAEMAAIGVPFGSADDQAALLEPGVAQELRLMSKSIRIRGTDGKDKLRNIYQVTVKGPGGISVKQLETPEVLTEEKMAAMKAIIAKYRPAVLRRVRKAYFEPVLLNAGDQPRLRPDGAPYTTEIDIYLSGKEDSRRALFINGEVEFHGATQDESVAEARAFSPEAIYFGNDLTGVQGVKAREIAFDGVPSAWSSVLLPHARENDAFVEALLKDYDQWTDPELRALMQSP